MRRIPRRSGATFRGGRNVALERRILEDLVPRSRSLAKFLAATLPVNASDTSDRPNWDLIRSAITDALKDHRQYVTDPVAPGRLGGVPLPAPIVDYLEQALAALAEGDSPSMFRPTKSASGRGNLRKYARQRERETAVRFLTAVRLGWIEQPHATKWVAGRLGMNRRQIQRWVSESGSPSRRRQSLEEWARSTWPKLPEKILAKILMAQASGLRPRGIPSSN